MLATNLQNRMPNAFAASSNILRNTIDMAGATFAALALAQIFSTWRWTNNTHACQHKLIHLCNEYALEVGGKASDHLAPRERQDGGHIALALALRAPSRRWPLLRSAVANGRPACRFPFASGRRLREA